MTLGWGIIGIGNIANRAIAPHVQELAESELVAVVSRDQGRAEEFAARHGARCAYTRYEDMLANPDVQVVAITTPNALHPEQAIAAAKAGKHVLCDKPLALTAADAQRVVEACREAGVKLGINFQTRHHACFQRARRLIAEGALGEVLLVQVEVSAGASPLRGWRTDPSLAGVGTINNIGVHAYDLLRYLLGAEVSEVVTLTDVGRRDELETMALALFRFANGTMAYVNANQTTPNFQPDIDIYGSRGRIVGHGVTRPWREGEMRVLTEAGEEVTQESTHDCYRRLIDDFNHAVLEGREPLATGLDGLRSVQLTEAMARSAREGRVIAL
ncbi:MAG TPA: Gfo/Idh/MocA family oxidoreductase [Candidatus Dormibacteraeota bacterium]|nr:Gfo/Idh/MocA family oxidoreductase [Candidatus Dormibacteraeota bacterium]